MPMRYERDDARRRVERLDDLRADDAVTSSHAAGLASSSPLSVAHRRRPVRAIR